MESRANPEFRKNAVAAIRFTMATQDREVYDAGVRCGIKGPHPIDGEYMTGRYPSWAAKFFMDAVLLHLARARLRTNVGS